MAPPKLKLKGLNILDRVNQEAAIKGIDTRTHSWFINKIKELQKGKDSRTTNLNTFMKSDPDRLINRARNGEMFFYFYDPKTKADLPYYDMFPLVIKMENTKNGFYGLNMHYIFPKDRLILLGRLEEVMTNKKYNDKTKIQIKYEMLKDFSKFPLAKPCFKKYLWSHVRSRFMRISGGEYHMAVLLQMERFVKENKSTVWKLSREISNSV